MTREEFNACMQQLLVFFRRPRSEGEIEDFKLYMDGLYSHLGPLRADLFHRTCFDMAGSMDKGEGKPEVARFKAIYASLVERERTEGKVIALPPAMTPEQNREVMVKAATMLSASGARMAMTRAAQLGITLLPEVVTILEAKIRSADTANPAIGQETKTS